MGRRGIYGSDLACVVLWDWDSVVEGVCGGEEGREDRRYKARTELCILGLVPSVFVICLVNWGKLCP